MVESESVLDMEKVIALQGVIVSEAIERECNLLEVAQACRAVMNAALAQIGGNAREIFLREGGEVEYPHDES